MAAPVTGMSSAVLYGSGVVFAASAGLLILRELWRALTGQLSEAEMVMVKESEEQGELEALQAQLAHEEAAQAAQARSPGERP
ncbi:hypothetical protein D9M72_552140 [compost metagenome]